MKYSWWGSHKELAFEVKNEHPIIKGLEKGMPVQVPNHNGNFDPTGQPPLEGIVLIGSVEGNEIPFNPMYVREVGKGRIVKCAWAYTTEVPSWSGPLEEFYAQCVNWAAHEDVDATW